MSNLERIQLLRQFTQEEPGNPFNWYALAIEFRESDQEEAYSLFAKLLSEHPAYLATYFPAAHLYAEMGEIGQSKAIFENGISLAREQKDMKALQELQNAYQNFLFENDLD
ncbi:tetratricopeptide repeat protein [Algoriphagus persicinus]|uniref:tetratricopeptide repeat protein n=1 Tax=Algoriphagus persicinus TaxID=3108754 RepID=UPI002B36A008|nr:tetratricopeptide repeat protein [Algoriphagus sp. E1-3-M2]MEB2784008.1 tetratricopeptide repeat protein [Algoriphagus sp. E1-3-M2]